MKKFFDDICDWNMLYIIVVALLFGMLIGVFFKSGYSLPIRTVIHNIYVKFNPDANKDSKTLILERAGKTTFELPQKDIFEAPQKKENKLVYWCKRVFNGKKNVSEQVDIKNFK